jgi:prepilin-type N-terminal cleavage/methylation domain-containing protein
MHNTQKGFTLVELAIVMTIIGLLIGGILKGQELMQNARLTATIAQVKAYEAALTTFQDKYSAKPGDMASASTRLPGCGTTTPNPCNPATATPGAGDDIVGLPTWATAWGTQATNTPAARTVTDETTLFWAHLLLADLISGVTNAAITGTTIGVNTTHPAAKINGAFVVGYSNGTTLLPAAPTGAATAPAGLVLMLLDSPTRLPSAVASTTGGLGALTPARAAQIDRKMDDGNPNLGYVQAVGGNTTSNTCYNGTAPAFTYLESTGANDCSLLLRIQG